MERPRTQQARKRAAATALFTAPFLLLTKYSSPSTRRIPANSRKVMDVPTAGMVTKVGTKVPMMLPMVLKAPRVPTMRPLSSKLSTEYFAREGVTVPNRNRGNTKITMQAAKAAQIRKLVSTVKMTTAEIPRTTYFPSTGMEAIHMAATRILP